MLFATLALAYTPPAVPPRNNVTPMDAQEEVGVAVAKFYKYNVETPLVFVARWDTGAIRHKARFSAQHFGSKPSLATRRWQVATSRRHAASFFR